MNEIRRGDVFLAHFGIKKGLEQGGKRPALIVSDDTYNQGDSDLILVIPFTTRRTGIPSDVRIEPPEGGLARISFVRCDHVRSISRRRLFQRFGRISRESMDVIDDWLRVLLSL